MKVFRKDLLCGLLLLTVTGLQAAEISLSSESSSLMERAAAAVSSFDTWIVQITAKSTWCS